MRTLAYWLVILGASILAVSASTHTPWVLAQARQSPESVAPGTEGRHAQSAEAAEIERGRYLAHDVAMCVICHSPKDSAGRVIESQKFRGDVMPVDSPFPRGLPWADRAPDLRTLIAGSEDEVFILLTTGLRRRTGAAPLGPMPPFRLSDEDARAIIAYLKSLD